MALDELVFATTTLQQLDNNDKWAWENPRTPVLKHMATHVDAALQRYTCSDCHNKTFVGNGNAQHTCHKFNNCNTLKFEDVEYVSLFDLPQDLVQQFVFVFGVDHDKVIPPAGQGWRFEDVVS